ncbi:DNA repair protein REV1 [Notothenia coriiceps]|uniref:DNA repair protein REV1 n=1 Tax=Notothenia coriiceps TaxID=8208 RepID=A0A6I9N6V0_9TELE|nr:PREDICTED: DNA repair protein REV1 [Notothenia coriiceps]
MSRDVWSKKKANASGDNGWAERGGYMAAKVSKLDEQFKLEAPREKQKDGTCSTIFSGISIYVNGYTDPSADELRRLMMLHGGQFHTYYSRSKTSHIITNNLPNSKIKELRGEKIVRPLWITDSIQAGCLLPCLQYQLYNQKGPLFPAMISRQTPEMAGPSHQKLHLPQRSMQRSVLNQESQNNSLPPPNHSRLYPDNIQPQSVQPSSAARLINPQPSHLASTYLNTDPRHRSPSHTHLLSNPSPTKPPLKPPLSPLQNPQANLQHQRAGQQQPHSNSSYNSSCKEVELKINGFLQTSFDVMSHSKLKEMQECGKADPLPQVVKEAHLTNGHSHLVNGALKPEDLLSPAQPSDDTELPQRRVKSSHDKPHSPPGPFQTKPDPYEFPQSPPKQSEQSVVSLKQSSSHEANEKRLKPPPPTYQEALKATETHLLPKQLHPSRPVNSHPEKTPLSPAHRSLSHSPVRLNGSHHNAFSSASLNSTNITSKPHHPTEKSPSPSKSSAQLMAQTGGLISEYYSHSRLHQISTWRSGFSEYVNELHSKRKAAGGASFPGRERLRKSVAQRSDRGGTSAPTSVKSCIFHVDMDCFFVSVGIRHRPELQGRPVAVTSSRGQGRVPLRPGAQPQLESQYYQRKHAPPEMEDEDLDRSPSEDSPVPHTNGVDQDTATLSRAEIASCSYEARLKLLLCSGSNILLARLATRKAKPDGQHLLKPEEVDDFIRELPVTSLPGVGPVMGRKLAGMGVRSCGDLQQVSLSQLQKKFGPRTGQTLFRFCRGLDERPVRYEKERKSVSAEMNYNIRFTKVDEAESFLNNLSMEVQKRLQDAGLRGRRVTLKVMVRKAGAPLEPAKYGGHGICDNLARTVMLAQSTDSGQLIAAAVIKLFHAMKLQVQETRGIGIQVQLLDGHHSGPQDSAGPGSRSIKQMFLRQGSGRSRKIGQCEVSVFQVLSLLPSVSSITSEPMEEDILQVVRFCTDLIEDKDLEKLDLIIKYMKRLMQRSLESVWSMAFDFILDNVQLVVQQTYGSTLKVA